MWFFVGGESGERGRGWGGQTHFKGLLNAPQKLERKFGQIRASFTLLCC